ncbi:hypothetical protein DRO38_02895, partial [Candidatus Bathyarchaeota archaeon]
MELYRIMKTKNIEKGMFKKNTIHLFFRVSFVIFLVFAGVGVASAVAPSITDWSSTGGTTQNKDNDQDIMYLIQQGDVITFNVTVTGTEPITYEWQVNKVVDVSATTNTFIWTVPNKKGIWEIHLKASNADGEDHTEWVISTLNSSEAPDVFDYFTDGKLTNRTETDPWGRSMQNWSAGDVTPEGNYECSKHYMTSSRYSTSGKDIYIPNTIKYGTWKYRVYFTDNPSWSGMVFRLKSDTSEHHNYLSHKVTTDSHMYMGWGDSVFGGFVRIDLDRGFTFANPISWHDYTIILTSDGWMYEFVDGKIGHIYYIEENPDEACGATTEDVVPTYFMHTPIGNDKGFSLSHKAVTYFDNLEIYENKYLFPCSEILYGEFIDYFQGSGVNNIPQNTSGIIIRKLNTTLADINQAINDPSKFVYNPETKTAISYVNITVGDAYGIGELILNGETLKFHGTSDGSLMLSVYHGSRLKLVNSTIDSDNNYYWKWRFSNVGDLTGYPVGMLESGSVTGPTYVFLGSIDISNSVINNSANFWIPSPFILKIRDSKILNLHADKNGKYTGSWSWATGERKKDWNFDKNFVWDSNYYSPLEFEFRNVTFSIAPDSSNSDIILIQNDELLQKLNLYDLDLGNANLNVMKVPKMFSGESTPYPVYYYTRLPLVNSKWASVTVTTDKAEFVPKYYLDVKVIDGSGNPVQGASIKVVNEVDDEHYPVENISETKWFFDSLTKDNSPDYWWQATNLHSTHNIVSYNYNDGHIRYSQYVYMPRENITATTGADGHTPLPAFPSSNSLVVADYVKRQAEQINFTYTITASKDGQTASMSGLDIDETWYREDPDVPTKTVVCNLGTGVCSIMGVSTYNISGYVKYGNGTGIYNARVINNRTSAEDDTDESGYYVLTGMANGTYNITAFKTGFYPNSTVVTIAGADIENADITLTELPSDNTPPVISDVQVSSITFNSATITWNTNELANSVVKYGRSSGSYSNEESNASYVTSHSITLTGLTPNTTYYFVVNSTDQAGNSNQSNEYNFTTIAPDITPPNITNVQAISITTNSATIKWDTDEGADTNVTYDKNPSNLGTLWKNNSELTMSHSITLTGLDDNTTYFFMVYSTDAAENTANSAIHNFTTSPVLPGNATVIIQAPNDVNDNRLREASPDAVLGSTSFIDVGRIGSVGNYRGVIWFNL